MRYSIIIFIALSACIGKERRTKPDQPENASCSEVGQWALDRCLRSTDNATCEGVYRDATESCQNDIDRGRRVCVPTGNRLDVCRAYVVPEHKQ